MQQSQSNVPVLQCVFSGWVFFVRNWKQSYWLGAPFIFTAILGGWINLFVGAENPLAVFGSLLTVFSWLLFLMMTAALYRISLGLPRLGLGGLNLGGDEYRLLAAAVLISIIAALVAVVVSILVMFALSPILASGIDPELLKDNPDLIYTQEGNKLWFALAGGAAFVWLVIFYLFSRFAPAFPAALAEKKIRIFEAAAWTKGQGWRIVVASLIAFSPVYILLLPGFIASGLAIIESLPAVMREENIDASVTAANIQRMRDNFHWNILGLLLVPALASIRVGLFSALYRGLRPS